MTDADWLAAVAAAPGDPLPRLAYADWLDDHDDPRGEQLRLDTQLSGLADADLAAEPLRQRLVELVHGTDARWRAAVCRVPARFDGWLDQELCDCEGPAEFAPALFEWPETEAHRLTRQPANRAELTALCAAARACYGGCVRYSGTDPVVIRMLGNNPLYCDHVIKGLPSDTMPPADTPPAAPLQTPAGQPSQVCASDKTRQRVGNFAYAGCFYLIALLAMLTMYGAFTSRVVTP